MDNTRIKQISVSDISEEMVSFGTYIVFDWDNTLKQYNTERHTIKCGVDKQLLLKWKNELNCKLIILSGIKPSRINLDTILIEVDRLGLSDVFMENCDDIQVVPNKYARKGNVIICGYDKAETFMDLFCNSPAIHADFVYDNVDSKIEVNPGLFSCTRKGSLPVVFFDDEEVNINNFSQIVQGSTCYYII